MDAWNDNRTREERLIEEADWADDRRIQAEERADRSDQLVRLLAQDRHLAALMLSPPGMSFLLGLALGLLAGAGLARML
jgi:hypothetical protein